MFAALQQSLRARVSPAFQCLVWKEYRAQRSVWLGLLSLIISLQVVIRLAYFRSGVRDLQISGDEHQATQLIWSLVWIATLLFAVCSLAMSFAGEREDRTIQWLIQLAPPPFTLLFAKLTVTLVGTLSITLITAVAAWFLGHPAASNLELGGVTGAWAFAGYVVMVLSLLIWGTLGSICSQRVLTSVPVMAVLWVGLFWIPVGISQPIFLIYLPPDLSLVGLFVAGSVATTLSLLITLWSAYNWAQGRFWDPGAIVFNALPGFGDSRVTSARPPLDLGVLYEAGELEQRSWSRLVWYERTRDRGEMFRLLLGVAGLLLLAAVTIPLGIISGDPHTLWVHLVCSGIPLVMGVLAYDDDQLRQPQQFLGHRGVSVVMQWWAKLFVWLPRGVLWTFAILLLSDLFGVWRGSLLVLVDEYTQIHVGAFRRALTIGVIPRGIWLIAMGYGAGQVAALCCKRTLLACIGGATLALVQVIWMELMITWDVPRLLAIGPMVAALFGFTAWQMSGWLLPDRNLPRWRFYVPALAIPAATMCGVAVYRAVEVRAIRSPSLVTTWSPVPSQSTFVWRLNDAQYWQISPATTTALRENVLSLSRLQDAAQQPDAEGKPPSPLLTEEQRQATDRLQREVELLRRVDWELPTLHQLVQPDHPAEHFPEAAFRRACRLMQRRTEECLHSNQLDTARDLLINQLAFCRFMAFGPFAEGWSIAVDEERNVCELITQWSQSPGLNEARLEQMLRSVTVQFVEFPSPTSAITQSFVEARVRSKTLDQLVINRFSEWFPMATSSRRESQARLIDQSARGIFPESQTPTADRLMTGRISLVELIENDFDGAAGWQRLCAQLPSELIRRDEVFNLVHTVFCQRIDNLQGANPLVHEPSDFLAPLRPLLKTTWGATLPLEFDVEEVVLRHLAQTRATQVRLALALYRVREGTLPSNLDVLSKMDLVPSTSLIDPYSQRPFQFHSWGLATNVSRLTSPSPEPVGSYSSRPKLGWNRRHSPNRFELNP